MISKKRIIPELLEECPEFQQDWQSYTKWMKKAGKARTQSTDALTIIIALLRPYSAGRTEGLPRFFGFLERLITDGDDEVRSIVVESYLQQLQFSSLGRRCGPDLFGKWMQQRIRHLWNELWRLPRFESVSDKISKLSQKKTEHLREYKIDLAERIRGRKAAPKDAPALGMRTKFGGDPDWVQNNDRPECYFCKRPMTFVAQIDSIEHFDPSNPLRREHADQQWMFGGVGMIYVFFCFYCQTTQSVYQCG